MVWLSQTVGKFQAEHSGIVDGGFLQDEKSLRDNFDCSAVLRLPIVPELFMKSLETLDDSAVRCFYTNHFQVTW